MNKNFDNEHAPRTSENCKKYSKSVSYETLVGGTATIGTGIKQTRRLFLSSANIPLTAVGTLTSLLCNSAKVVENILQMLRDLRSDNESEKNGKTEVYAGYRFCKTMRFLYKNLVDGLLQMSPVFRLIKILCLLAVLSVGITTESQADDENLCQTVHGTYLNCIEKLTDENGNNSCGTNCTFRVIEENGKQVLHVYKEDISKPATIREGAFSPYFYKGKQDLDANGNALPLNNIMLDNDFEYAPLDAFAGSNAQISSASGKFVFNNGQLYFGMLATLNGDVIFNNSVKQSVERTRINGDVIISDNVKSINGWSFDHSAINGNLVILDTIKSVGQLAFKNLSISGQIYCASGIENCYNMIKDGCEEREDCLTSLENLLNSNKFSAYPDGCLSMGAKARCTKCKSASFKLEDDGWCLRKIYTPAEAAEVLRNDDNTVTITFRK